MLLYFQSGFYVYDIDQCKWIVITEDAYSMGGPAQLFDHQMCMDMEHQTIYVYGGKIQGYALTFLSALVK